MIRGFGFLYIESEADWEANYRADWQRIEHNVVEQKPNSFPACFELSPSWDSHSCGMWIPCDKSKMVAAFEQDICDTQRLLNKIKGAN